MARKIRWKEMNCGNVSSGLCDCDVLLLVCRGNAKAVPIHRTIIPYAGIFKSCQIPSLSQQLEHLNTRVVGCFFVLVFIFLFKAELDLLRKRFSS